MDVCRWKHKLISFYCTTLVWFVYLVFILLKAKFGDEPTTFITWHFFLTNMYEHMQDQRAIIILTFVDITWAISKKFFLIYLQTRNMQLFLFNTKNGSWNETFGMYWLKSLSIVSRVFSWIWIISFIFLNPRCTLANWRFRQITNSCIGSGNYFLQWKLTIC